MVGAKYKKEGVRGEKKGGTLILLSSANGEEGEEKT